MAASPRSNSRRLGGRDAGSAAVRHTGRTYWWALTRAAQAALLVHLCFSALFFALGAPVLGWANVGSVLIYVVVYRLLRRRQNFAGTVLVLVEIPAHAVVATWVLGWDSGFHYYLLVMMPVVFVSPARTITLKLLVGSALGLLYLGLDAFAHLHAPHSDISASALVAVRYFNIATTLSLLGYLAHFYFGAVLSAERKLHDLAATDVLTGLANRRRMQEVATNQMGRRRRDGTPLSFMLADVDHFKIVNDQHGHDTGDHVLVEVARALKASTRESDTVGRWGGEEFLVLLPETELTAALQVAERARDTVQKLRDIALPPVTITIGVSTLRDGETLEEAIVRADDALYRGKVTGRNRCVAEAAPLPPQQVRAQG